MGCLITSVLLIEITITCLSLIFYLLSIPVSLQNRETGIEWVFYGGSWSQPLDTARSITNSIPLVGQIQITTTMTMESGYSMGGAASF